MQAKDNLPESLYTKHLNFVSCVVGNTGINYSFHNHVGTKVALRHNVRSIQVNIRSSKNFMWIFVIGM